MMRTLTTYLLVLLPALLMSQSLNGLVSLYPFNGDAIDISANANNGTVTQAVLTTDRFNYANSAYQFDGVDDVIEVSDSPSLRMTGDFTLMAWMNPSSIKSATIIRKGRTIPGGFAAYRLATSEANSVTFSILTDVELYSVSDPGYSINQWQLVTGVVSGSSITIYVNGVAQSTLPFLGSVVYDNSSVKIGSRTEQPANTFDGKVDDVKIYNRALSAAEILAFFNQSCPDYLKISNTVVGANQTHNARYRMNLDDVTLNTPFDLTLTSDEVIFDPEITVAGGSDVLVFSQEGCN